MIFEFKRLREYLNHIVHTLRRIETHMVTKTDLDAALTTIEATASALVAEQAAAFERLIALIGTGAPSDDLQAEVDRLVVLNTSLAAALKAAQVVGVPAQGTQSTPSVTPIESAPQA